MRIIREFVFAFAQLSHTLRQWLRIPYDHYAEASRDETPEVFEFARSLNIPLTRIWDGEGAVNDVWRFRCATPDIKMLVKLRWGNSPIWETLQRDRDDH